MLEGECVGVREVREEGEVELGGESEEEGGLGWGEGPVFW